MKRKKRINSLVVGIIIALSLMSTAFAEVELDKPEEPEVPDNPYTVIQTTQASLTKNNSTASVSGTINAAAGTSKVTIKLELQVKSGSVYSTVKTWTKTAQSNYAKQTGSYSINSSKTYRLKATFTATKNGSTETATVYKY